jgi:hypothetical protein
MVPNGSKTNTAHPFKEARPPQSALRPTKTTATFCFALASFAMVILTSGFSRDILVWFSVGGGFLHLVHFLVSCFFLFTKFIQFEKKIGW